MTRAGLGQYISQQELGRVGEKCISHLLETTMSLCFRYFLRSSRLTVGTYAGGQGGQWAGRVPKDPLCKWS